MIDWLLRDRTTGRIVVAQWPNLPFVAFLLARGADRLLDPAGAVGTALAAAGTVALLWWAGEEVVRGVNPFRRILGSVVGLATLVGLVW